MQGLQSNKRDPDFALVMAVSRPVILQGVSVFLPHGENVHGDMAISGIFTPLTFFLANKRFAFISIFVRARRATPRPSWANAMLQVRATRKAASI